MDGKLLLDGTVVFLERSIRDISVLQKVLLNQTIG